METGSISRFTKESVTSLYIHKELLQETDRDVTFHIPNGKTGWLGKLKARKHGKR